MLFDLMPMTRGEKKLMNLFDDMNRGAEREVNKMVKEIQADVIDNGESYLLLAEIPGFEKEEIHIDVEGDYIALSAEHNQDAQKGKYVRRERHYGAYRRAFDITGIDAAKISAKYKNGVLEVTLPKLVEQKPKSTKIAID